MFNITMMAEERQTWIVEQIVLKSNSDCFQYSNEELQLQ